jgi:hypothetical protein
MSYCTYSDYLFLNQIRVSVRLSPGEASAQSQALVIPQGANLIVDINQQPGSQLSFIDIQKFVNGLWINWSGIGFGPSPTNRLYWGNIGQGQYRLSLVCPSGFCDAMATLSWSMS